MHNQIGFSPIIILIIIVLLGGVLFAWQYFGMPKEPEEEKPGIEVAEETMQIKIYLIKDAATRDDCSCEDSVIRTIPKTSNVAKVALEELIKGPTKEEEALGYGGCLPDERTVANYENWYETKIVKAGKEGGFANKFRSPDGEFTPWGKNIEVKSVEIKDGIAYADFSKELYSYGGGSCFVEAIITSINNTLLQFPTVKRVEILVEGKEPLIQP